jgi:hypothetical protein
MDARRRYIGAALIGVVVAGGVCGANAANAGTTTATTAVYASDDAYTSSLHTTTNYGTGDQLVVGAAAGESRVSYVMFSTGTLPAGSVVARATLRLPLDGEPVAATLRLYPVATTWSQGKVTAASAPALSAAVVSIMPKVTDIDATFDVSKWVTRAGTYAFAVKSASTTAVTRLRSVEYGDPTAGGPQLSVTYTRQSGAQVTTVPTVRPAADPTTAASTAPATPPACVTGALLVPSCGVLWGAAAGGFSAVPGDVALKDWEALTGRTATIFHAYHRGDELFPSKTEIAMSRDPAHPRVLLLNWKVAYKTTWAKVAAGAQDTRIDNWAKYVKANYTEKFFLALHHEPENDVNPAVGSGMTAKDYAAMYRHVVLRMRADGVTNAVNVIGYMGNELWLAKSWWKDLYPGDDVVDWIGLDSYVSVEKNYYHYGDMSSLLDRQPTGGGLGFYDWAGTTHPTKPIMVAEWGMYHRINYVTDKSAAFDTVVAELKEHPKVKAVVYFDTARDDEGDRNISVNSTPQSLAAFRKVAADPMFKVDIGR